MSDESIRHARKTNWTLIIAVLSLIIAIMVSFLGLNLQSISSYFTQYMFPKSDFAVESWTTPRTLPSDFTASLVVSPQHIVVTSVKLKSEEPYLGDPLQFSISFENIGKQLVEQPRLVIHFVDPLYQQWGIWNNSIDNDIFTRECSFDYNFPSLDQKIIGRWGIFILVYDDADNLLVSYALKFFIVTDVAPIPWWESLLSGVLVILAVVVIGYFGGSIWSKISKVVRKPKSTEST